MTRHYGLGQLKHIDSAEHRLATMVVSCASLQAYKTSQSLGSHCRRPSLTVWAIGPICVIEPWLVAADGVF